MFRIVTDSTADLPKVFLEENHVACINLTYILDGTTYGQGRELSAKEFFDGMRAGKMPTTSQVNPEDAKAFLEKLAEEDTEILVLAFSSGLSGSYNSMRLAAREIMEESRNCRIRVVDSLCASMGEGLFVCKALQLRQQGMTMEETANWLEEHRTEFIHVFTVNDLFHLFRGGRVSRTTAVIGSLAGIKPMLHVDDEGHLVAIAKVRGRKKALQTLVSYMEEKRKGDFRKEDLVMISHGDCLEDAEYVRELIREKLGMENVMINTLGPVIGAHTGPGLVALFFIGTHR